MSIIKTHNLIQLMIFYGKCDFIPMYKLWIASGNKCS